MTSADGFCLEGAEIRGVDDATTGHEVAAFAKEGLSMAAGENGMDEGQIESLRRAKVRRLLKW